MNAAPPVRDRVAFALLVPSLAVPITALALAAWRMSHVDDGTAPMHFGHAPNYFAIMLTLTATFFSMALNSVLAMRNHASLRKRAIPLLLLGPHYVVCAVVAVWAVEFCLVRAEAEGGVFWLLLVFGSVFSLIVVARDRVAQPRVGSDDLGSGAKVGLYCHPIATITAIAGAIYGLVSQNEVLIVAVAVLALLGLPWSGFTGMLWFPVVIILFVAGVPTAMPLTLIVLAATPAVANAALSVVFLQSSERRTRFINDFFEAQSFGRLARNTLST